MALTLRPGTQAISSAAARHSWRSTRAESTRIRVVPLTVRACWSSVQSVPQTPHGGLWTQRASKANIAREPYGGGSNG